jgi:hypothetical protein
MTEKKPRRIVRPAIDVQAVRLLESDPDRYFKNRRKVEPFGFAKSDTASVPTRKDGD